MNARRRVESTGVELTGGAELVTPVEKAAACGRGGGEEDGLPCSGAMEMPADRAEA